MRQAKLKAMKFFCKTFLKGKILNAKRKRKSFQLNSPLVCEINFGFKVFSSNFVPNSS